MLMGSCYYRVTGLSIVVVVVVVALSEQEGQEDVEEGKKRNIIYLTLCDIIIVIPSRG